MPLLLGLIVDGWPAALAPGLEGWLAELDAAGTDEAARVEPAALHQPHVNLLPGEEARERVVQHLHSETIKHVNM